MSMRRTQHTHCTLSFCYRGQLLCRDTQQPNDPNVHSLVGCVHNFTVLVELQKNNEGMHDKLLMLAPFIHQYRPVIGDGNCFYRWCAPGLALNVFNLRPIC